MIFPTDDSYSSWQTYVKALPSIAEQWVDTCKRWGNPVVLLDSLGAQIKSKSALTGTIIFAKRIKSISPEQNIGTILPASAGGMIMNMAGIMSGKTVVNLNFTAGIEHLLSAITQADIKTVYSSARFLEKLQEKGFDLEPLKEQVNLVLLEDLSASVSGIEKGLTLLLCKLSPSVLLKEWFCEKAALDAPAVILFSSGSEGQPKGVILSHHNLITNIKQIAYLLQVESKDLILANLPFFHAFGLTVTVFMPLIERIPVYCHPDPTDAFTCANLISKHDISIMFGTSSFYRLYVRNNKIPTDALDSLRLVIAGAEKLKKEVSIEFTEKFNKTIYEGYGATETAPVASVNIPDYLNQRPSRGCKDDSVGLALPGTEIKITDPDTFQELPIGEAGMILISGGQIMLGYLNNLEKSNEVLIEIDDRIWYATGDKGYLDEEGFLFIQDRYSRFAKIAGEMVGLGLVEVAIRDVLNDPDLEVIAVNLPHPKKGEQIVVLCTHILDSSILRDKLIAFGLSRIALPSAYIKIDDIPLLGSGKTDFNSAKKLALEIVS